jgi:hypothetical protein
MLKCLYIVELLIFYEQEFEKFSSVANLIRVTRN